MDPELVGVCHCIDCQALSASAFRTIGIVQTGDFYLLKGNPKVYVKTSESGHQRVQAFCETCGSAIYSTSVAGNPEAYSIRMGIVNQRA